MFLTFTRKLPKHQAAVIVNTDLVIWAQEEQEGWTTLFLENGPEVIVQGTLKDVTGRLNFT